MGYEVGVMGSGEPMDEMVDEMVDERGKCYAAIRARQRPQVEAQHKRL